MAGYTRQHAVSIVADALIIASDLSDEFNAVQTAFNEVSGHAHHGAGDGAAITFIGPGGELQTTATTLQPIATNIMSIGTTGLRFRDGWFQGAVTAAGGFAGALTGNVTGNVTGNASTASALAAARTIALTGAVAGSVSFDGSANASITTTYSAVPATATALATARTIALTGPITGSASFDGTANASIATSYSGEQNLADNLLTRPLIKDYGMKANARGSITGAQTLDMTLGNYVTATIGAAVTFTFSNPTGGTDACGFVLKLTNGGAFTITWPASVKWPSGVAPTLTTSGVDVLTFFTDDAGTTWRGTLSALDSR